MRDGHRPSQSERPRRRRHVLRRQSWGRRTFQDPCVTAGTIQFHPQAFNYLIDSAGAVSGSMKSIDGIEALSTERPFSGIRTHAQVCRSSSSSSISRRPRPSASRSPRRSSPAPTASSSKLPSGDGEPRQYPDGAVPFVSCGRGSWGGRRPSLADYVTGMEPTGWKCPRSSMEK